MASRRPLMVPKALFCPQCGQAIRPVGSSCPHCGTGVILAPKLARGLQSHAETLVPVQLTVGPDEAWRQTAGAMARAGAHVVDLVIIASLNLPLTLLFAKNPEAVPLIFIGLIALWHIIMPPLLGGTPGMRTMGLAIVDVHDGGRPDLVQSTLRTVGYGFALLTLGLSLLASRWHPEKAEWHDLLAGTRLIEARAAAS